MPDVFRVLKKDHDEVKAMLAQLEEAGAYLAASAHPAAGWSGEDRRTADRGC